MGKCDEHDNRVPAAEEAAARCRAMEEASRERAEAIIASVEREVQQTLEHRRAQRLAEERRGWLSCLLSFLFGAPTTKRRPKECMKV